MHVWANVCLIFQEFISLISRLPYVYLLQNQPILFAGAVFFCFVFWFSHFIPTSLRFSFWKIFFFFFLFLVCLVASIRIIPNFYPSFSFFPFLCTVFLSFPYLKNTCFLPLFHVFIFLGFLLFFFHSFFLYFLTDFFLFSVYFIFFIVYLFLYFSTFAFIFFIFLSIFNFSFLSIFSIV